MKRYFLLLSCLLLPLLAQAQVIPGIEVLESYGFEDLPYKQGVIGSNPIVPTEKPPNRWLFSCAYIK